MIGARKFLIAYNVNLNTKSQKIAHDIAMTIREAGRNKRDANNKFVRDENGVPIKQPGTLKECKAVGWYIDEYKRAQISINLTDFDVTPPHVAFDEVVKQAESRGVRVTGSELVGLIPLEAMLKAGTHYLEKANLSTGLPEEEIVETAVQSLGLRELSEFDPQQKIIEYRVAEETPLVSAPLQEFVDLTSTDSPASIRRAISSAVSGSVATASKTPSLVPTMMDRARAAACRVSSSGVGMARSLFRTHSIGFSGIAPTFIICSPRCPTPP